MKPVQNALIVANTKKELVHPIVELTEKELSRHGVEFCRVEPNYFKLNNHDLLTDFDDAYCHRDYDVIFAIGGDGTFLYTARTFMHFGIPVMGINAGRVGFLMEIRPDEIKEALDKIISGHVTLEKRILLEAQISREGRNNYHFHFLNDAVVSKGALSRMVEIGLSLDKEDLSQYRADGLIVATPTGSTAYNLSAGGPILTPDMEAMVITPICPHILGVRPIVTASSRELEIRMISGEADTTLTIDGQESVWLKPGDKITIRNSGKFINIFDYGELQYFSVLREKLGWHV